MSTSSASRPRRRYRTLDDLRAQLDAYGGHALRATAQWTPAQIFHHLAAAIETSCTAPAARWSWRRRLKRLPQRWYVRFIGLPTNIPIPAPVRDVLTPPADAELAAELPRLHRAVDQLAARHGAFPAHPFLGPMTAAEWRRFHLRHCELHLRHVVIAD